MKKKYIYTAFITLLLTNAFVTARNQYDIIRKKTVTEISNEPRVINETINDTTFAEKGLCGDKTADVSLEQIFDGLGLSSDEFQKGYELLDSIALTKNEHDTVYYVTTNENGMYVTYDKESTKLTLNVTSAYRREHQGEKAKAYAVFKNENKTDNANVIVLKILSKSEFPIYEPTAKDAYQLPEINQNYWQEDEQYGNVAQLTPSNYEERNKEGVKCTYENQLSQLFIDEELIKGISQNISKDYKRGNNGIVSNQCSLLIKDAYCQGHIISVNEQGNTVTCEGDTIVMLDSINYIARLNLNSPITKEILNTGKFYVTYTYRVTYTTKCQNKAEVPNNGYPEFTTKYVKPIQFEKESPAMFDDCLDFGSYDTINHKTTILPIEEAFTLLDCQKSKISKDLGNYAYFGIDTILVDNENVLTDINNPDSQLIRIQELVDENNNPLLKTGLIDSETWDEEDLKYGLARFCEETNLNKEETFGKYLFYKNNGLKIKKDYTLFFPVQVKYLWGQTLNDTIQIKVCARNIEEETDTTTTTPIFCEDFENGIPETFTLLDLDGCTPNEKLNFTSQTWTTWQDPQNPHNKVAAAASWFDVKKVANDWMITPRITLPKDTEACHLYWRSRSAFDTYKDGYYVWISEKEQDETNYDFDNWSFLKKIDPERNTSTWHFEECDLSKYAGKEIQIAFNETTNYGWMLFIDDIYIGERNCLPLGKVVLTNDTIAYNEEGTITFDFCTGIRDEINNFEIRVKNKDNVTLFTEHFEQQKLLPNTITPLQLKQKMHGEAGTTTEFSIELLVNGKIYASDQSLFLFGAELKPDIIGDQSITKRVVGEILMDRTNDCAPWAYEGNKKILTSYPETCIMLNYHTLESENPTQQEIDVINYTRKINKRGSMTWSQDVLMDKKYEGKAYYDIDSLYNLRINQPILAKITNMDSCVCYKNSIELKAQVQFALSSVNKKYDYMFVVVEDSVSKTLYNRYATGYYGDFLGYENLEEEIDCQFNDVVRAISGEHAINQTYNTGDTITLSYVISAKKMDIIHHKTKLKAVVLILDKETGEIMNAYQSPITFSEENGPTPTYNEEEQEDEEEDDPIEDDITNVFDKENIIIENNIIFCPDMKQIEIFDLSGRLLYKDNIHGTFDLSKFAERKQIILNIKSEDKVIRKKLSIN